MTRQCETKEMSDPMAMSEQGPIAARAAIQSAPGFGVESEKGRANLELHAPLSEYREMQRIWGEEWNKGQIDAKIRHSITMPVPTAKATFAAAEFESYARVRIRTSLISPDSTFLIQAQDDAVYETALRNKGLRRMFRHLPKFEVLFIGVASLCHSPVLCLRAGSKDRTLQFAALLAKIL